ncbi:MAG: hypothetical protein QOI74_2722 [Micromonosporaceae bacterium]|nr:hypothetical protein [Micromonosporaceae bacterium]
MAGRRLAAAGVFAAAVAVAATLWIAPHPSLDTPAQAVRQAKSVVITVHLFHMPAAIAESATRMGSHLAAGVSVTGVFLFGLVLLGLVERTRRRPTPALAPPTRIGRAPPPPADPRWTAAIRRR